jgi:hypothetical protein
LNRRTYGNHGSLSIKIENGTWYDFENKKGGGVIDLIKRCGHEPTVWLRAQGLLGPPDLPAFLFRFAKELKGDHLQRSSGSGQSSSRPPASVVSSSLDVEIGEAALLALSR